MRQQRDFLHFLPFSMLSQTAIKNKRTAANIAFLSQKMRFWKCNSIINLKWANNKNKGKINVKQIKRTIWDSSNGAEHQQTNQEVK